MKTINKLTANGTTVITYAIDEYDDAVFVADLNDYMTLSNGAGELTSERLDEDMFTTWAYDNLEAQEITLDDGETLLAYEWTGDSVLGIPNDVWVSTVE